MCLWEANSHDQINMTKLWLEYDRNIFTTSNSNIGTWPKNSQEPHNWTWVKNIFNIYIFLQQQTLMLSLTKPWQRQTYGQSGPIRLINIYRSSNPSGGCSANKMFNYQLNLIFRKDKSHVWFLKNVCASFSVAGIYCMLRNCKMH